jgi:hypothetical protein
MAVHKIKRWSQHVTKTSNALDLDRGVFTLDNPRSIARSLKRSADRSRRRKSDPFRSAMSMLNFYINRAGKELPRTQRARLEGQNKSFALFTADVLLDGILTNDRRLVQ